MLDHGCIAEAGTYEDLAASGGSYQWLNEIQFLEADASLTLDEAAVAANSPTFSRSG